MTSSYSSRSLENWKIFKYCIFFSEKKTWAVLKTVMPGPYWPWRMPIICTTGTLSECHPAGRHLQGVQLFTRYFINWKYLIILKEMVFTRYFINWKYQIILKEKAIFTMVSNPAAQCFLCLRNLFWQTFSFLLNFRAYKKPAMFYL